MYDGWIKLHRKIIESPVFDNPNLFKLWAWCLCKATHKEREEVVGKQIVKLLPGQFVFGRLRAAEVLKMNDRTVYDYIKMLEKLNMIRINSNNKFSLITIENWALYQYEKEEVQQQNTQHYTIENTIKNDTNNNVKNVNNTDNEKSLSQNVFIPPTLEEVKAYCETRNYCINAQDFIDYYAGKNWMVDNAKMKNWKRAVITWETRSKNGKSGKSKKSIENIEQLKADFTVIFNLYPKEEGFTDSFKLYIEWVTVGRIVNGINYKLTNRQIYKAVQKYIRFKEREDIDIKYWVSFKKIMDDMLIDYVDFEE